MSDPAQEWAGYKVIYGLLSICLLSIDYLHIVCYTIGHERNETYE
jgi:hypothetical protein